MWFITNAFYSVTVSNGSIAVTVTSWLLKLFTVTWLLFQLGRLLFWRRAHDYKLAIIVHRKSHILPGMVQTKNLGDCQLQRLIG